MNLIVTTTYHNIKNIDETLKVLESSGWGKEKMDQLKEDHYARMESKHPDYPVNDQRVVTTLMIDVFPNPDRD